MVRKWNLVLTIITGAAAGFAGSLLARGSDEQASTEVSQPSAAAATPAPDSRGHTTTDQAAWLRAQHEQRLAQLEDGIKKLDRAQPELDSEDEPGADGTDLEAVREEAYARWAERLDQHETEPVDAAWSGAAESQLEQEISTLSATENFELLRTQCRTNTCSATVQWPSYGGALDHFSALLHADYKTACAREVVLPEPTQRDAPYEATVLFDCTELRAASTAARRGT